MRKSILFLISKKSGYECLKSYLSIVNDQVSIKVITLNDTSDIRSYKREISELCLVNKIEFDLVNNNEEFNRAVVRISADSLFVCGWYWILEERVIEKFEGRVYGIHHSLLPAYRGFSPLVWAMINGEKIIGSSLFKIENGIDTGEIYYQWRVDVSNRKIGAVLNELEENIAKDFGVVFDDIISGKIIPKRQDEIGVSYCARRNENSGRIVWNQNPSDIVSFIRAQTKPYPGAYFKIDDKKFIVDDAEVFGPNVYGQPGQIAFYEEQKAIICCGDYKAVKLTEVRDFKNHREIFRNLDVVLN